MELEKFDDGRLEEIKLKKALLQMRREGHSYDEIAEVLGLEDRFEVISMLNEIYKTSADTLPRPGPDVREVVAFVDGKIDDLISVFHPIAMEERDIKAANFVIKALKTKAEIHGAISPSQINVNVTNAKPWENVYQTVLVDSPDVIDGEVVDNG